jgi:hypothetical protein
MDSYQNAIKLALLSLILIIIIKFVMKKDISDLLLNNLSYSESEEQNIIVEDSDEEGEDSLSFNSSMEERSLLPKNLTDNDLNSSMEERSLLPKNLTDNDLNSSMEERSLLPKNLTDNEDTNKILGVEEQAIIGHPLNKTASKIKNDCFDKNENKRLQQFADFRDMTNMVSSNEDTVDKINMLYLSTKGNISNEYQKKAIKDVYDNLTQNKYYLNRCVRVPDFKNLTEQGNEKILGITGSIAEQETWSETN